MTDDATSSIEPWLSALRQDVQPMSPQARERLALSLAGITLATAAGAAIPAANSTLYRGFLYSRAFTAAVTLPIGMLIGAAGHAYLAPRAAAVTAPVAAAAPPVVLARPALPPAVAEPAPTAPSAPKLLTSAAPSVKFQVVAPSLERELSLLERARSELSEGQPQITLRLLREHQAAYPTSPLQQEREALTIRALLAAGRRSEAQRRAQSFIRAYPTSALRGSVESVAETIP